MYSARARASGHIDQRRCDNTRWYEEGCASAIDPTNRRMRHTVRQPVVNTAPCSNVMNFGSTEGENAADHDTTTIRNALGTLPTGASLLG